MIMIDELLSKGYGIGNSGNETHNLNIFKEPHYSLLLTSVKVSCGNHFHLLLTKLNMD